MTLRLPSELIDAGLAATDAPIRAQLLSSDDGVHLVDPAFAPVVAV